MVSNSPPELPKRQMYSLTGQNPDFGVFPEKQVSETDYHTFSGK